MTARILIAGSRDWTDADTIRQTLSSVRNALGPQPDDTLVSGACPTGADAIAEAHWRSKRLPVERHPADWSKGRCAGPERNAHMVALGADVCVAFIGPCTSPRCHRLDLHPSHGATGCADRARWAGIDVVRVLAPSLELTEREG